MKISHSCSRLHLFISHILCSRLRPLRSRSTPSGPHCPNWAMFTSTMPLAQPTEPTGEQGSSVVMRRSEGDLSWLSIPHPRLTAPWWEWIFPRRQLASWWRRSWTTLPWLWRNPRGPSWPSSEGKNSAFPHRESDFTQMRVRAMEGAELVAKCNPGSPLSTGTANTPR